MKGEAMTKGYWIGHMDVHDAGPYSHYLEPATQAVHAHGGKFLARGGTSEIVEGAARARHVIVEFPSMVAARECYGSAAYQAARAIRQPHSAGDIVIVEGL